MATFTYNVRNMGGSLQSGTMSADSRVDALNSLRNKGLFVLELVEQEAETQINEGGFGGGFFQRVKLEELAVFTKQLAAMVGAGISITRCLTTLSKQQKNDYFANVLLKIKNDVASGLPLSASMAKYPRIFNSMTISLLVAAEETGTLDSTLEELAATFEAEVALRQQISAGMRYPLIVATAAGLVVIFVMIFVVPQFKAIFETLGAKLPWMTQIVINLAVFMKTFWWLVLGLFFGFPGC